MSALLAISPGSVLEGVWNIAWCTAVGFAALVVFLKVFDR